MVVVVSIDRVTTVTNLRVMTKHALGATIRAVTHVLVNVQTFVRTVVSLSIETNPEDPLTNLPTLPIDLNVPLPPTQKASRNIKQNKIPKTNKTPLDHPNKQA